MTLLVVPDQALFDHHLFLYGNFVVVAENALYDNDSIAGLCVFDHLPRPVDSAGGIGALFNQIRVSAGATVGFFDCYLAKAVWLCLNRNAAGLTGFNHPGHAHEFGFGLKRQSVGR